MSGDYGQVKEYVYQKAEDENNITSQRFALMHVAEEKIALLTRAVKHGMATTEETELLEAWEVYTVKLNRMKTTDTAWPDLP